MRRFKTLKKVTAIALMTALTMVVARQPLNAEQRKSIAHPNTSYQLSFYNRHNYSYRVGMKIK